MISKGIPIVKADNILEKISEADIVGYYLNINKIPILIHSPFRQDKNPSFSLYSKGTKVYYKDFSTKESGDTFSLLMHLWNMSFLEVLEKIQKDMLYFNKVSVKESNLSNMLTNKVKTHSSMSIKIKTREWRDYDIEYWKSYGVSLEWLKYCNVYPISHKWIIKDNDSYLFPADKYAYAYVEFKEGNPTYKIYQPFNKEGFKWQNSHNRSIISLWTKIPHTGDKVCICSSVKDALCLMSNLKIPSIALQGEGYPISDTAINNLKNRFDEIYVCFDNDSTGLKDGESLSKQHDLINVIIPQFQGGKDISDYYKTFGKDMFISTFKSLFKDSYIEYESDLPF